MFVQTGLPRESQQTISQSFQLICESRQIRSGSLEQRNSARFDYASPVYLTPLDAKGRPLFEDSFGVLGRQISEKGFDFFHKDPIPHQFVIASFEYSPSRWVGIKMKLKWCRFAKHGYFENGGEFLETADSPFGIGVVDG